MKRTSIVKSIAATIAVMFMAGTAPVFASEISEPEVLVEEASSDEEYRILHTTEVFELPGAHEDLTAEFAAEESTEAEEVETEAAEEAETETEEAEEEAEAEETQNAEYRILHTTEVFELPAGMIETSEEAVVVMEEAEENEAVQISTETLSRTAAAAAASMISQLF